MTVADQTAPTILKLAATPRILRPAWWQMIPVKISTSSFDSCDPEPKCKIIGVTTNIRGDKSDNGKSNWVITGDMTLDLRAVPSTRYRTHYYRVTVECVDASGNRSKRTITITVARDTKEQWK